jgi:diadenosine tetraphosphate (Ap4A) HIT family hydrolase
MNFELHPSLAKQAIIINLPLCQVLLHDESLYPWVILVPRKANMSKIMDLSKQDQWQLMQEIDLTGHIIWDLFHPKQLNVAALGNKTPQLHIHVIGRQENDPAWPNTVWDHPNTLPYTIAQKEHLLNLLQTAFNQKSIEQDINT